MNRDGIVLFDTGILLRASTTTLDHADLCLSLWTQARAGTLRACIAQQSVWEFFSVLTRLAVPQRKVLVEIRKHLALFPVIAPKDSTFPEALASLARLRWLSGPQVYDLFLAHTALDNQVTILYTLNDRHFRRFGLPLRIVNPASRAGRQRCCIHYECPPPASPIIPLRKAFDRNLGLGLAVGSGPAGAPCLPSARAGK